MSVIMPHDIVRVKNGQVWREEWKGPSISPQRKVRMMLKQLKENADWIVFWVVLWGCSIAVAITFSYGRGYQDGAQTCPPESNGAPLHESYQEGDRLVRVGDS